MNWKKVITIALVGGVAFWLYDFLMHGVLLGKTYMRYDVFAQEPANPMHFLLVEIMAAFTAAILFLKTRSIWGPGPKGGATFGLYAGAFSFFPVFINPLVIEGFPYYLSWCWGTIALIGWVMFGAIAGALHK